MYDSHFSYITKFKSYAKKYQCPTCSRFIGNVQHLPQHIRRCKVDVEEVYVGGKFKPRKTVFEDLDELDFEVPEECSICSNIPEHEEPVHLQTDGDPQKLVDDFVDILLEHQTTRVGILNQKYESVLNQLKETIDELKEFLGIKDEAKTDTMTDDDNDDDANDEEIISTGVKRKKKHIKARTNKRSFLDLQQLWMMRAKVKKKMKKAMMRVI